MLNIEPWGEDFTPAPNEEAYVRLNTLKAEIVQLFIQGDYIMFQIADRILTIEREELYRAEVNQDTGEQYRTMTEYYPALLSELKQKASLHKLSERQVREYVRLKKVFVDNLQIPERKLLEIGPSHFTELAESLDYDHRTGQVRETPREGKLGKSEVLDMLEQIEEGEWRVADTRAALNEARGVENRSIYIRWGHEIHGKRGLPTIEVYEGNKFYSSQAGMPVEICQWLTKKLGASSNLGGD